LGVAVQQIEKTRYESRALVPVERRIAPWRDGIGLYAAWSAGARVRTLSGPRLKKSVESTDYGRIVIALAGLKLKYSPYRFGIQRHLSLTLSFEDRECNGTRPPVGTKDGTDSRANDLVLGDNGAQAFDETVGFVAVRSMLDRHCLNSVAET
jgi:hypothetical protein